MLFIKKVFVIALCITCFIRCTGGSQQNGHNKTIDITFKQGEKLRTKDWVCYNLSDSRICIPSNWKFEQQSKYYFFSELDGPYDVNSFFVIAKYDKLSSGLGAIKYLKETFNQLKRDTVEKFMGYTVKKLIFNDKVSYYCEYFTSVGNKPYIGYSTIFEQDGNLFDITLKTDSIRSEKYRERYRDVLFNIYRKNEPVFSAKDNIKDVKVIDITKL